MAGDVCLQMFQNWLMNELTANEHEDFIYIQDGAPPHWKLTVRSYLNDNLPGRWIGRAGGEDNGMLKWPPRSPDLISCDFFSLGICEQLGLCLPFSCKCKRAERITTALETVMQDMLHRVWKELCYRLDVCRATSDSHIVHL